MEAERLEAEGGGRWRIIEGDLGEIGVSKKTTWRHAKETLGLLSRQVLNETEVNFNIAWTEMIWWYYHWTRHWLFLFSALLLQLAKKLESIWWIERAVRVQMQIFLHILFVFMSLLLGTSSRNAPSTESIKCRHLRAPFIFEFLCAQLSYNTWRHVKQMDLSSRIMTPLVSSKANLKAYFNDPVKNRHQPQQADVTYFFL